MAVEQGHSPSQRTVALLITFFTALVGGFTFAAILLRYPATDPVAALILAAVVAGIALVSCLVVRDSME